MNLAEMVSGDNDTHITREMSERAWKHFVTLPIPMPVNEEDQEKRPSFLQKVWNYLKALFFHTVSGFDYADWPTVWKRRKTCNACPKRDPKTDSCKSCGCSLNGTILGDKLRWASSTCPEGRW